MSQNLSSAAVVIGALKVKHRPIFMMNGNIMDAEIFDSNNRDSRWVPCIT